MSEYHPPDAFLRTVKKRVKAVADVICGLPSAELRDYSVVARDYSAWCRAELPSAPETLLRSELDTDGTLSFVPPIAVDLTGTLALGWVDTAHLRADLLLRLPAFFFKSSDFHQYRFHRRRVAYLMLLSHLVTKSLNGSGEAALLNAQSAKPSLVLLLPLIHSGSPLQLQIRFHLAISPGTLKLNKLEPWKFHLGQEHRVSDLVPTDPLWMKFAAAEYNRSILEDAMSIEQTEYVAAALKDVEAYRLALIFLRAWFRARPESSSIGFWSFLLVAARLHYCGVISGSMLPLDIFRQILSWWSQSWPEAFLSDNAPSSRARELWQEVYRVTLADPTGRANLASKASMESWEALREDAVQCLKLLVPNSILGKTPQKSVALPANFLFQNLFLRRTKFNFDAAVRVPIDSVSQFAEANERTDRGTHAAWCLRALQQRLYLGWGARVLRIQTLLATAESNDILLGVVVRADQWRRQLDHGPEATDLAAVADYKTLWGDKAHLRRFKDGRILYCVLWDRPEEQRHLILQDVARFLLKSEDVTLSGLILDSFLQCVSSAQPQQGGLSLISTAKAWHAFETAWDRLRAALLSVGTDSAELPLRIQSVRKMDDSGSSTGVRVPVASPLFATRSGSIMDDSESRRSSPLLEVCRVILQFEASGAWPAEIAAVERVKAALLLKLTSVLQSKLGEAVSAVQVNSSFLDVFAAGYVFRLLVFYPREIFIRSAVTTVSNFAQCYHLWFHFEERPRLTAAIRALHGRYPAFGPTAQLVKRWLASQLVPVVSDGEFPQDSAAPSASLSLQAANEDVVPELLVDLLTAHVFTEGSYCSPSPPAHYYVGFLRVLELLAHFPFASQPLVVDWNSQLSAEDHESIQVEYENVSSASSPALYVVYASSTGSSSGHSDVADSWLRPSSWRSFAPAASIFGCLNGDRGGACPSSFTIERISDLALEMVGLLGAHTALDSAILGGFVPNYSPFDVVVRLNASCITRWHQNAQQLIRAALSTTVSKHGSEALRDLVLQRWASIRAQFELQVQSGTRPKYRNLGLGQRRVAPADALVAFDPVRIFANLLRTRFSGFAHVLHDDLGGDVVCLKWKRGSFNAHKNFRLSTASGSIPVTLSQDRGTTIVIPNVVQLLQDIRQAAPDLVASIEVQ